MVAIVRGDILLVKLDPVMGSEQGKTRPCVVIQNNVGNQFSPNTIVVPITSQTSTKLYPTDVRVNPGEIQLPTGGIIKCEQIRSISIENRVLQKLGHASPQTMQKVDAALKISLALA